MSPLPLSVGLDTVYSCAQRLPSLPEKTLGDRGPPSSVSSLPTQRTFLFCIFCWKSVFDVDHFLNLLQSCFCFLVFFFFWMQGMWDLSPRPGFEPPAPALEGKIVTTGPPGKSCYSVLIHLSWTYGILQVHEFPGFSGFSVRTILSGWGHRSYLEMCPGWPSSVSPGRGGERMKIPRGRFLPEAQQRRSRGLTGRGVL